MTDLLEYKEEFEVGIREAAESLDEKVDLTNSIRKVGSESDLILAGWIKNWSNDHINEEDMLNVILPRNPLVYMADLSFTFRDEIIFIGDYLLYMGQLGEKDKKRLLFISH